MKVIGVDPDAKKHGVAIYIDGVLRELRMLNTVEIMEHLTPGDDQLLFSIEDVCANNGNWHSQQKDRKGVIYEKGRCLGRVQQAQLDLMRWLEHYDLTYVLHRPSRNNWANNKVVFEAATAWEKQSNVDTRSAAYFGYLDKDTGIPIPQT